MKLVTSATMRAIDSEAIEGRGIPSEQLMERAGGGIAERILYDLIPDPSVSRVAVFCGKGNNGGDGFVIARHLHKAGVDVGVFFLGPIDRLTSDARLNFDRAAGVGVELAEITDSGDLPTSRQYDLIVDAVFGTGFAGAPRGMSAEVIEFINLQDALIVAVDLPSGLNADNGRYEGAVVQADYTYPLALPKFGLFLSPGRELAGDVEVVPIGIPLDVIAGFDLKVNLAETDLVTELLPIRTPDGHKGDFGRTLIVAGSTGMTGAAAMAGISALRGGCGLAKIACPREVLPVLASRLMEVMTCPLPDVARKGALALRGLGELRKLAEEHDAVVIGPGLGRHRETFELVRRFVTDLEKPAIIDADGLNAFEGHLDILKACRAPLVLTPHPGEFRRLSGTSAPTEYNDRIAMAQAFADEHDVVLALKGSPTLIAGPGSGCWLNPTGNHGMATGGSGDVLSGLIGSLLAQGMSALDAAVCGAYIHGLAGDFAAESLTPRAMIAGDIIDAFPQVFELLEE